MRISPPWEPPSKGAENQLKRFSYKAERLGRDLTTRVSLPILGIGAAAVSMFAGFDKAEKGLAVFAGSADKGAAQLDSLLDIVKDTRTTLDLKEASAASLKLQSVGQSAGQAENTIRQLGIAATVSGSSIEDVGGVVRQFSQILGKGKIEQEDLNSILDRMPALAKVIKEEFGVTTAEGIRETGIAMETFVSRLVGAVEANKAFQNVQGGISKSLDSFGVELQIAGKELGEVIAKTLNLEVNLGRLASGISTAVTYFKNLSPPVQKFIIGTAAAAAAMGPLTLGLGAAARTVPLLTSGFKLFSGPLLKVGALALSTGKQFAAFSALLGTGGALGRAIALSKVLGGLKLALAVLTGPIAVAVAVVGSLVAGFVLAYKRSEFFRGQIARLGKQLEPVKTLISDLANKVLSKLGVKAKSVGGIFLTAFGAVGATISFIIEGINGFVQNLGIVGQALGKFLTRDFSGAAELISTTDFIGGAKNAANAFATTFKDIVGKQTDLEVPIQLQPDGTTSASTAGGVSSLNLPRENNARKVSSLQEDEGPVLNAKARDKLGDLFKGLVSNQREAEFLQEQLSGLQINPNLNAEPLNTVKSVMASLGQEIQDNLGTAFTEVDIKAQPSAIPSMRWARRLP